MGAGDSKHRTSLRPQDRPLPPGKPTLVPGTPGTDPDVITIKWESPEWNGGAKITGYSVEHRRTGSPHWVRATPVQIRQHQLTLSGLEPGMRYQFRVFADSSAGRSEPSPLSEPIAVSYHRTFASAPCFIKPLHDTVAIENEKVEFTVQVQGTPAPKLVWYKDGFEVYSSRRQRIVTENDTSSLVIHQAAFRDEGEIKCSATNKAGHVVTKAQLRLEGSPSQSSKMIRKYQNAYEQFSTQEKTTDTAPPTIRLPRQYEDGLLFELGETVRLKISVTGRPQPQVHWLHDGEEVVTGGKQEIITTERYTTLKVLEVTRQDRGEYQVKAVNRLGEDLVSFLVTITDRPLPPGKAHVVMTLGRCVTLSWSAPSDDGGCKIGNYIVEYYRIGWNMWLKAATCRQLTTTLGDLIEGSEYKFRVKAENPYGISEPSDESDVIFIPDPKRGLLEPPARDGKLLLNEEMTEEWLEARKKHNELVDDRTKIKYSGEQERKGINWEEESPIPSPVMLANQVLRKVKMAPKRGWSDDSQASPPRSPERPVPPQRKSRLKHMKAINEYSKNVKDTSPDVIEKIEYHSTRNVKNAEESLHSSSELMLVLVPNSRADTEERETEWKNTVDSLKNSNSLIAPPMSLSAPELGSCEPVDFSLMRYSVSSTELLHERAMARFYQENTERESENELKKRYGIERKRSFERRSPKPRIEIFAKEQSFSAEIHSEGSNHPHKESMKNEEEGCSPLLNIDASKCVTAKDNNSDRFIQSEKVFKELIADSYEPNNEYKLAGERDSEKRNKHSPTRIDDYFSDESDEDTYHPNMASRTGVMSSGPLTLVVNPTARGSEQHNTIDDSLEFNEPDKSIMDEEGQGIEVDTKFPPMEEYVLANQSNNTVTQSQPLKPILKVRDYPQENRTKTRLFVSKLMKIPPTEPLVRESCSTSDESKTRKKVRIEEPDEKYAEELVGEGDRDVLLTGEVARNRRKQIRQNLSEEEVDPTRVMISHYSDIVREFGYGKKPRAKLYLDYEDLKAAADRVETEIEEEVEEDDLKDTEETKCAITHAQNEGVVPFAQTDNWDENISAVIEVVTIKVPQEEIAKKPKSSLYFLVDIILFLVACWIYMFNDERLAIPIMFLMIYRQMHEFIQRKFKKWKKT